ncbi:hypothetical protein [Longirhabdus pacifica]|uniref:hypothetical protein n=1 Tax=Longirhabdus pacifica TaxID=2305227 RepID=UPI0010089768|nr:hypothetical protein [Longirhabdus pacifica]
MNDNINKKHIFNLAPMECTTSCILTYLNMKQKNSSYFLLSYWHLTYYQQVLMSGTKKSNLNSLYGVKQTYYEASVASIVNCLHNNQHVILMCRPDRLNYFPRENLIFNNLNFMHAILIYNVDEEEQFHFIDPTEDYVGTMSATEVEHLIHRKAMCLALDDKLDVKQNEEELILSSIQEVYRTYMSYSVHALHPFKKDFAYLNSWSALRREQWLKQHNVMISAIVKTRKAVWQAYEDVNFFTPAQHKELEQGMNKLLKQWMYLNFSLLKFKNNSSQQLIENICHVIDDIARREKDFILLLKQYADETKVAS